VNASLAVVASLLAALRAGYIAFVTYHRRNFSIADATQAPHNLAAQ